MCPIKEVDNQKPYTIPKEGSLGLLALGDVGLRKWREVRDGKRDKEKSSKNS